VEVKHNTYFISAQNGSGCLHDVTDDAEGVFRTHWLRCWVAYRAHFYIAVKRKILALPELYSGFSVCVYR
jgi:hypothetical protein